MEQPIPVRIFGAPLVTCANGEADAWQKVANWTRRQLTAHFGQQVSVEYYDLFSPEMDRFPEVLAVMKESQAVVPLVFVGEELLSSGGKVSTPAIRRRLEALGLRKWT